MDLGFYSRTLKAAKRAGQIQSQRGFTYTGHKIWEESEDQIIRELSHLTVAEIRKRLPHRSDKSIETRRRWLDPSRRKLRPWTTHEDRLLRANIETMAFTEIAKLLSGRNAHAVQGRAWYLGLRKGCRRDPKNKGLPVYDEVRRRAYEDGLSMQALDCELKTGKYFQDNHKKLLNWKKLARAVEFFGGRMTIDWNDI